MPLILELGISMTFIASSRPPRATYGDPVSLLKIQNKNQSPGCEENGSAVKGPWLLFQGT